MINTVFVCDLCKRDVHTPCGGFRLSFSGDGAIGFEFLDSKRERLSETVICNGCIKGLKYGMSKIPVHPTSTDCDRCHPDY